jgi:hypothetical protein
MLYVLKMQAVIPPGCQTHLADGTPIDPRVYLLGGRPTCEADLSLWNDPRWKKAKDSMSKDQIAQYKNIGNQMHGSIDYTTGVSNSIPIPEPAQESISYILTGLRSGLDAEDLDADEITTLETFIGKDWRSKVFISSTGDEANKNEEKADGASDNQQISE